jgi:general secretion pathway protein L
MIATTSTSKSLPDPSSNPRKGRFFGLDLSFIWHDLQSAWRDMLRWRAFAWITPKQLVRLNLPDGTLAWSENLQFAASTIQKHAVARFEGIVLPERILLRRNFNLPNLPPAEMEAALAMEVMALSPFPKADVVWCHDLTNVGTTDSTALVQLVMTSRKLVAQHVESVHPSLQLESSEVVVPRTSAAGFQLMPGFGESRRLRRGVIGAWVNVVLALVTLALLGAMAVTPSVQLFFRFTQGYRSMIELQSKAAPVIVQRESFVRTSDQLVSLSDIISKSTPPLQALQLISQALPDDTSLLSLQIQAQKVNITGQTVNAAALMKLLDSTPGLRDVRAPSPATKPLGAPRESFAIEFMLEPTQIKVAQ